MCLGALVHGGVPLEYLRDQLSHLGIAHEYQLRAETVHRHGQQATKVHIELVSETHHSMDDSKADQTSAVAAESHSHPHSGSTVRHLPDIEQLILQAQLPQRAETWSLAIFRRLAQAEATVHGIPPETVHFHEVGATDAIVDIVGTCLGLDWLGIDQIYCSALPTGGGTVRAAHGWLPVPAPAVLALWVMAQVPVYSNGIPKELVTPTGAAIVTTLATEFGEPPAMNLQTVGLGAGSQNLPLPNILRLWIGDGKDKIYPPSRVTSAPDHFHPDQDLGSNQANPAVQTVAVLETQIDDLSPQRSPTPLTDFLQQGRWMCLPRGLP